MAMTLDGFLPDENHPLMRWVKTYRNGFPYWQERCSFNLPVGYPMLSLIAAKGNKDDSFVYLAEIGHTSQIGLLQALMRYKLADEWFVYLLPLVQGCGIRMADSFAASRLEMVGFQAYGNGVCRMIYRQ